MLKKKKMGVGQLRHVQLPHISPHKKGFNLIESRSVAVRKTKGAARRLKFEWPLAKLTDEKNA